MASQQQQTSVERHARYGMGTRALHVGQVSDIHALIRPGIVLMLQTNEQSLCLISFLERESQCGDLGVHL